MYCCSAEKERSKNQHWPSISRDNRTRARAPKITTQTQQRRILKMRKMPIKLPQRTAYLHRTTGTKQCGRVHYMHYHLFESLSSCLEYAPTKNLATIGIHSYNIVIQARFTYILSVNLNPITKRTTPAVQPTSFNRILRENIL